MLIWLIPASPNVAAQREPCHSPTQGESTAQQAIVRDQSRFPAEIVASICECLDSSLDKLSVALCSKSTYSNVAPSLYRKARLFSTFAQTKFAYALALQQGPGGLAQHVESLELALQDSEHDSKHRNAEVLLMIIARCPASRTLGLVRRDQWSICTQADIDALSKVVAAPPNLRDLTLRFVCGAPDIEHFEHGYIGQPYTFEAEDTSLEAYFTPPSDEYHLVFPQQLTDQLGRLRSFSYTARWDFGRQIIMHCLGVSLRSLYLSMPMSGTAHLEQLANNSPNLASFVLDTTESARVSDVEVCEFLERCGGTLKKFSLSHLT